MLLKMNHKSSYGYRYDVQEWTLLQKFMSPKMSILLNDTLGYWCDEQVPGSRIYTAHGGGTGRKRSFRCIWF